MKQGPCSSRSPETHAKCLRRACVSGGGCSGAERSPTVLGEAGRRRGPGEQLGPQTVRAEAPRPPGPHPRVDGLTRFQSGSRGATVEPSLCSRRARAPRWKGDRGRQSHSMGPHHVPSKSTSSQASERGPFESGVLADVMSKGAITGEQGPKLCVWGPWRRGGDAEPQTRREKAGDEHGGERRGVPASQRAPRVLDRR